MKKTELKRLAYLLYKAPLAKKVKEAWLSLLPKMKPSQLKALLLMLESYQIEEELLDESFEKLKFKHQVGLKQLFK